MKKRLKQYFIPHEENEHQPHSLRDKSVKVILGIVLGLELITLILISPILNIKLDYLSAVLPGVLVLETNEERQDKNLNTLEVNELLVQAAQLKANDMAEKGYFSHVTPDGKQPWYFLTQAGYSYYVAGENLAVNFVDSKDVHNAWMNSPTHKENILKGNYTEIGIATARGKYNGRDAIFVAQFFGTPKIQPEPVIVEQETNNVEPAITQAEPETTEEPSEVAGISVGRGLDLIDNLEEDIDQYNQKTDPANLEKESVENNFVSTEEATTELSEETPVVATQKKESAEISDENNWATKALSSPRNIISTIIMILTVLVLISLILKVFVKLKVQYPKMIINGILLVTIMGSFYLINSVLVALIGQIS